MSKTRSNKEIAKILLDNMQHFRYGLCQLTNVLCVGELMTYKEKQLIYKALKKHYNKGKRIKISDGSYWWEQGNKEVRIKFLKDFIIEENKKLLEKGICNNCFERFFGMNKRTK